MAAKGQRLKEAVIKAILETFPENTFFDPVKKEIRFEGTEDGNPIQIKIAFTCAKDLIERNTTKLSNDIKNEENKINEITKEEKENVEELLHSIGY